MEMLLMGVCLSVFGIAVTCLAFGAAVGDYPDEQPAQAKQPALAKALMAGTAKNAPAHFFREPLVIPMSPHARVPIELLMLEIENHVRLEHAAAESFLATPSSAMLHSRTMSTLVN